MTYDVAIIGAGVNGVASAFHLSRRFKHVALMDQGSIASGGSGAAGAFISPKFSKGGELKRLISEAFVYSLKFYQDNFPDLIDVKPLLHIARREDEALKIRSFKNSTELKIVEQLKESMFSGLNRFAQEQESIALECSGVVDAKSVCCEMAKGVDFICLKVDSISYENNCWHIGDIRAKRIVLSTGASAHLVPMPHIRLRAVWGHRIDISTTTQLPYHLHQLVSISATDSSGKCAIGATHDLNFKLNDEHYIATQRQELLDRALKSVDLKDIKILKDYAGFRSGSNDYLPMMGRVADLKQTLKRYDFLKDGFKMPYTKAIYHKDLYMLNGVGGYGFVLAPLLAKKLTDLIVEDADEDEVLSPSRFITRYAKKALVV